MLLRNRDFSVSVNALPHPRKWQVPFPPLSAMQTSTLAVAFTLLVLSYIQTEQLFTKAHGFVCAWENLVITLSALRKPITSKLPQATKGAQLLSPEEKRTPLPCLSRMNTGSGVRATPGLKPPQHVRIKMAFSISSQVLHQFIPSAINSHQVPHILFPLYLINLIFFSVLFFKLHPFSLLAIWLSAARPSRTATRYNSWRKVLLKHPRAN